MRSKSSRLVFALSVAFAGLSVIGLAVLYPEYGEICKQDGGANQEDCAVHSMPAFFAFQVGEALNDYGTALVALATLAIAIFTWKLFASTRQQVELTKIIQRAHLSAEPLGIALNVAGDALIGHVNIRNAGNLPAQNVRWFLAIKSTTDGDAKAFLIGELRGNVVAPPGAVMPRGTRSTVLLQELAKGLPRDDREGPVFLYVWGQIDYQDGFGNDRWVRFCHRYNWMNRDARPGHYAISKEHGRYHEHGNGTDESPPAAT